jgi:GNAT superfamily N-acetyltransferase
VNAGDYLLRNATEADVDALVELVNLAYRVEDFFINGNRTYAGEVCEHLHEGTFIVAHSEEQPYAGTIFTRLEGDCGYFGMLAVDPRIQSKGLGRRLIAEAERRAAEAARGTMRIVVVNLRTELFPWYNRLGYEEDGTEPFMDTWKLRRPAHFIRMRRPLLRDDAAPAGDASPGRGAPADSGDTTR